MSAERESGVNTHGLGGGELSRVDVAVGRRTGTMTSPKLEVIHL